MNAKPETTLLYLKIRAATNASFVSGGLKCKLGAWCF